MPRNKEGTNYSWMSLNERKMIQNEGTIFYWVISPGFLSKTMLFSLILASGTITNRKIYNLYWKIFKVIIAKTKFQLKLEP